MKSGDKVRYIGKREVDAQSQGQKYARRLRPLGSGTAFLSPWNSAAASILLALLLCGCAARKPAIRPGHDREHPSLTPVGKVTCRTGLLKLFGSYGPRNCVNEQDVKPKPIFVEPDGTTITCFWLNAKQSFFCPTTLPLQGIEQDVEKRP